MNLGKKDLIYYHFIICFTFYLLIDFSIICLITDLLFTGTQRTSMELPENQVERYCDNISI